MDSLVIACPQSALNMVVVPFKMSKIDIAKDREQRLAAKLRENLKRRKVQAKARADTGQNLDAAPSQGDPVKKL